jgi:phosphoglycolate phosphatase-like HAD superfamily hydrolase
MAYVIFDLDGTVIDSSHRKATLADGSLDLAHWFENNTPEKIALDTLLPLARVMKILAQSCHVIVCTARAIQQADLDFMAANGLKYNAFLSREHGNDESDESLKERLLTNYFKGLGFANVADAKAIFFDDNLAVLDTIARLGVTCYDATIANQRLARRA